MEAALLLFIFFCEIFNYLRHILTMCLCVHVYVKSVQMQLSHFNMRPNFIASVTCNHSKGILLIMHDAKSQVVLSKFDKTK